MKKWPFILIPLVVLLLVGFTGISAKSLYSLPTKYKENDLSENINSVIINKETTPVKAKVQSTNISNPEPIQDNSSTKNVREEPEVTLSTEIIEDSIETYDSSADPVYCPNYGNCPNYEDCPGYFSGDCPGYGNRNGQENGHHRNGNARGHCPN